MLSRTTTAAALVVAAACSDARRPTAVDLIRYDQRASVISDASRDGVPGFYFLPPMVKGAQFSGAFDATLAPAVVICEFTAGACVREIARFTPTEGTDGSLVTTEGDHYQVNWHTKESDLSSAKTFRITAYAAGAVLGFADLDVVDEGGELKNVADEYVPLLNGRTLPINFRAENGIPARIAVDPAQIFLEVGDAQPVSATVYDLHDAVLAGAVASWSIASMSGASDNATFASGTLTAASPGTGTLTAAFGGRSASAAYTVYEPPATLGFEISCSALAIGASRSMAATAFDAAGAAITRPLRTRYASSDAAIALANETSGEVTGIDRGLVTVSASLMGLNASTNVLVFSAGDAITIAPSDNAEATTLTLELEGEAQLVGSFKGIALGADTFSGCRTWSNDNTDVLSLTADGHIKALAAGTASVTLAIGELSGSFEVEVEAAEPPPEDPVPTCGADGCTIHDAGWLTSKAVDVNSHGEVLLHVQVVVTNSVRNRAFFWDGIEGHPYIALDLSDATHCTPTALNDSREIVGNCIFPRGSTKTGAVYWNGPASMMQHLTSVAGAAAGIGISARDINNAGTIVGSAPRSYNYPGIGVVWATSAALWSSVTATPITYRWRATWTGPSGGIDGISQGGRMAGVSSIVQGYICSGCTSGPFQNSDVTHAGALPANSLPGTTVSELATLSIPTTINNGLAHSYAFAINDAGVAVGWTEAYVGSIANIRHQAVRWTPTFSLIPGVPAAATTTVTSEASDINNDGWITGAWGPNAAATIVAQAFVWKNGGLAIPLPRPANSVSARGNAISELVTVNGEVVAYVAGQVSIGTSSALRARLWVVKQ